MAQVPVRRARIADVAREAGVSKAAVSFAFNTPERLSSETAARIRSVAASLGYRPDPVARMLAAGQTTTIGVLSPQPLRMMFANPFFSRFAEGVAAVTEEHGFGLLFVSPLRGSLERALARATVDGVLVVGLDESHPEVEAVRRADLPMVLVDAPAWREHASVAVDDEGGAAAAARHLVELGHRDLLVVAVEPPPGAAANHGESVWGRRLRGYRQVLDTHGIPLGPERVLVAPATFEGGEEAFRRARDDGLRPTGVLVMSDAAAAGVIGAARGAGLRVPEDVSVVGFDDLPLARYTDPPLTTVHQPVREKGEEAARMLLESLGGASWQRGVHRVLDTRLVVRRSTTAARATMW